MVWGLIASGLIGAGASIYSGNRAANAAEAEGQRIDQLEREKFAQAKEEAARLRELGDEAAAVALEEAELADLGAERFEEFSNEYAQDAETFAQEREDVGARYAQQAEAAVAAREAAGERFASEAERQAALREEVGKNYSQLAQNFAARNEQLGIDLYDRIGLAADERQRIGAEYGQSAEDAAQLREEKALGVYDTIQEAERARAQMGEEGAQRLEGAANADLLRGASQNVMTQAERAGQLQTDAFGNVQQRYTPFLNKEQAAVGQLGAELGLSNDPRYTGYRSSPAYQAAQEASRVAEQEAISTLNQDAANAGSLYSGTRGAALIDRAKRGSYERAGIEQNYYQNYLNMLQQAANPQATGAVSGLEAQTARDVGQNYIGAAQAGLGAESTALEAQMRAQQAAEQSRQGTAYTGQYGTELLNAMRTGVEGAPYEMGSLRTGAEGSELRDMLQTGTEGADYRLNTMSTGVEGAPYYLGTRGTGVEGAPYQLDTMRTGVEGYPIAAAGFNYGTAGSPYRLTAAQIPLNTQATAGGMITGNMPSGVTGANFRMEGVGAQNAAISDLVGGGAQIYSAYLQRPQGNYGGGLPQNNAPASQWNNFYGGY